MEKNFLKYLAMYLRKSRGDIDSDLDKHRMILTELCEKNKWTYVEYVEIGTGDSISARPVMSKLLDDVESGMYDAVCVVDIDRLGRGDMGDQDRIKKVFARSKTLIVTPQHIYNLENETDDFTIEVKGFIARQEYKLIVKRLIQGKKIGARRGMWTNGTPPIPYEYERYGSKYNPKGLVVNDAKLKTYRYIIDSIVKDKKSPTRIAREMNALGYKSPRGGEWTYMTVYRVAIDKTHLGYIVSNKTKGNPHKWKTDPSQKVIYLPEDEWVVVKNCHEAVKTLEEHEKILVALQSNKNMPRNKPSEPHPLSGLIKCGVCGATMNIHKKDSHYSKDFIRRCWRGQFSQRCINMGGSGLDEILETINKLVVERKQELQQAMDDQGNNREREKLMERIELLKEMIRKRKDVECRIIDAYENGVYDIEQFKKRKEKNDRELNNLKNELEVAEIQYRHESNSTKEKIEAIDRFLKQVARPELDKKKVNSIYKAVVREIIWTNTDTENSVKVRLW